MVVYKKYTVKKGDSLWLIAQNEMGNGSRYPEIKKLNGLTSDVIKVGQVLKIPVPVTETETTIKEAFNNCLKAIENLDEFKTICDLMGW